MYVSIQAKISQLSQDYCIGNYQIVKQNLLKINCINCFCSSLSVAQPAKVDLNKKSFPKQKTIQNFTIDAQGFRKTKNENLPTSEIEVTS